MGLPVIDPPGSCNFCLSQLQSSGGSGGSSDTATCSAGKTECGSSLCISSDSSTCCDTSLSKYCGPRYYCITNACCKIGKACSGGPRVILSSDGDDNDDFKSGSGSSSGFGIGPTTTRGSSGPCCYPNHLARKQRKCHLGITCVLLSAAIVAPTPLL